MIEKYVPSEEDRQATKKNRDAYIGRIYAAFGRLES
jgi:hypothetical protein